MSELVSSDKNKTIVEINGVKLEVDLRTAKRVDQFRVGDNVKVLIKRYSHDYESYAGVIIGFDEFKNLPTIIIAYCETSYSTAAIKFAYLNAQSKDIEICHMHHAEKILDKARAVDYLDREITKAQVALDELKSKRNYFLQQYGIMFDKPDFEGVAE